MSSGAEREAALLAFTPETTKGQQMHASMMGGNNVYKSNVDSIKKRLKQNERGLNSKGQSFQSAEEQEEDLANILGDASVYGVSDMFKGEANKLAIGNRRVEELEEGLFFSLAKGDTDEEKKKNSKFIKQALTSGLTGDALTRSLDNLVIKNDEFEWNSQNFQSLVTLQGIISQKGPTGDFMFPLHVREPLENALYNFIGIDSSTISSKTGDVIDFDALNVPYTYQGHNKDFKVDVKNTKTGKIDKRQSMQFVSTNQSQNDKGQILSVDILIEEMILRNKVEDNAAGREKALQMLWDNGYIEPYISPGKEFVNSGTNQ